MLKDISSIRIQGTVFSSPTSLPVLDCTDNKIPRVSLLYGKNGTGKSTIAKAFRKLAGEEVRTITSVEVLDKGGAIQTLLDTEKASIFVFDEDFVTDNIRIDGDGLGSIIMLGEQADLTVRIETEKEKLKTAEQLVQTKEAALNEFKDRTNPKAPQYYLDQILVVLRKDDGWAGKDSKIKGNRQNTRVNDDTYKRFIGTTPAKTRDELIIAYAAAMKELEIAKSGSSKIIAEVPVLSDIYKKYTTSLANELLKKKIEKPELSEREQYLLSLVTDGKGEEIQGRIDYLSSNNVTYCPYCLQDLTADYKNDLIFRIQKILTDEVKKHQSALKLLFIQELSMDLSAYKELSCYQTCIDLIEVLNELIRKNNMLLQSKIDDVFTPITKELSEVTDIYNQLHTALNELESERIKFNSAAADTQPIKNRLLAINDQIAYYDVITPVTQMNTQNGLKNQAQKEYNDAVLARGKQKEVIETLDAQRKRIDIAIDIINNSLKYIFFAEGRLSIARNGDVYRILSHGKPVQPKDISVGERNIIGLSYFFTKILQGKRKETAYDDEYLIVIDDPVSSYDLENKVGILSFLKYKMSQFLCGNANTKIVATTHDLLTFFDLEKMCKELQEEWDKKFSGQKTKYSLFELKNCELERFQYIRRHEYTELLKQIFDYAQGNASEYEIVIGNIMRQALEAFSTFEYKKGIEKVSTDDVILDASGMCEEHKSYFKNLMYRIVLNGGSHREEQARSMEMDFLSLISEAEKRRTAQEILCFIYLLNKPHLLAHIGDESAVLDGWCNDIKTRSAVI